MPAPMKALPNTTCPLCGGANQCAPASTGSLETPCWCTQVTISREALARIPADSIDRACLCPRCAGVLDAPGIEAAFGSRPP
jgi:hypothetical protein